MGEGKGFSVWGLMTSVCWRGRREGMAERLKKGKGACKSPDEDQERDAQKDYQVDPRGPQRWQFINWQQLQTP